MEKANRQTIENAFLRFTRNKDEIIRAGMYGLLEDAVQIALEAHDEAHQAHIELGDTYGWMLVHNHKIEEVAVVATAENKGKASRQLRAQLKNLPKEGWVGVVMAGLKPAKYFSVHYELGILGFSFHMTKDNFFKYFKPL